MDFRVVAQGRARRAQGDAAGFEHVAAVGDAEWGSSAIHAAARFRGIRGRPYRPVLVLFGYAELVYQVPTSLAGIAFAGGPLAALADVVSVVMLVWFALVVHRAIELHYGVSGDGALAILLIGGLAFYLLPLILIGILLVAIVVAAAILQYF